MSDMVTAGDTEWWRGAVIYQVYPRSFRDSNGDGLGDLAGIVDRLEHVASLGVDGIWICPFFRSPMTDFGYDVADYTDVDPIFGTLADADRLIGKAHRLGLKVVIDMVLSHSSDQHPWFLESRQNRTNRRADWYVWADPKPDGTPPNNWLSVFGGSAWQWEPRRGQYYLHNFLTSQPDLDLHNPAVQDALLDACRFWLDRGVDGFRLDVANFYTHDRQLRDNPPLATGQHLEGVPLRNPYGMQRHLYDKTQPETLDVLRRLRQLLDGYPDRFSVAEIHDDTGAATCARYVAGSDLLHTAYGFGLLSCDFSPQAIRRQLEEFESQPGGGWPAWSFSNHDVVRAVSRWGAPEDRPRLAALLVMLLGCLRGTVFLYQGEELGLPEADVPYDRLQDPYGRAFWPEFKGRDGCRTPMPWTDQAPNAGFCRPDVEPWLPVPPEHLRLAATRQAADPDSTLSFTRAFLAWRRSKPVLRNGVIRFVDAPPPVLAFIRGAGPGAVICIFNLGREPVGWEPPFTVGDLVYKRGPVRHGLTIRLEGFSGAIFNASEGSGGQ